MAGRDPDDESAREKALHAQLDRTVQKYRSANGSLRKQMRAVRRDGWTAKRRAAFLEALALTCNVQESARLAGMSIAGAYDLRKRDAGFAALWEEAKEQAYDALEARIYGLINTGIDQVETIRLGDGPDATVKSVKTINRIPVAQVSKLLAAHRASVERHRLQRAALALEPTKTEDEVKARLSGLREFLLESDRRETVG